MRTKTGMTEALRKALGVEGSANLEETTTTTPFISQKAIPVTPEGAGAGVSKAEHRMLPVSAVLTSVLRPRLSIRSGKVNWGKTFERMKGIYNYLSYFAHKGDIRAEKEGEEFDLLETFYLAYPEARGQVKSLPVFVPNLLLDSESLERVLDPRGNIFKTYFSRLVNVPGLRAFSGAKSGGSPEYNRLREEVTRAYASLVDPKKGGESYREILAGFLEAYLSYASKVRFLPKPEEV